jgi:hypothetical protein
VVPPSDALCRSYLDLRWHLDPAAATAAGVAALDGRLGRFDDQSIREHLAAFRALEAGVEELAVEAPEDELDRTALLDDIRVTIFRLRHERAHRRSPAFWLLHLCDALAGLLPEPGQGAGGRERAVSALARLQAMPEFLRSAAATLTEPAEPLIEAARALVDPAASLVTQLAECITAGLENDGAELAAATGAAEGELAHFQLLLETNLRARGGDRGAAVGTEEFERLLHHLHAVRAGAAELWRVVERLEDELEGRLHALERALPTGSGWGAFVERSIADCRQSDVAAAATGELARLETFLQSGALVAPAGPRLRLRPMPEHRTLVTGHATYRALGVQPVPEGPEGQERQDGQVVQGGAGGTLWVARWPSTAAWISPVVAEAGIPGHHLQACRATRLAAEFRRHSSAESPPNGWGVYMVDSLEEAGYWSTPDQRVMACTHLLLRTLLARIDLGLHTRGMSPEDGIRLLSERLSFEPPHARAMVWGCCLHPTLATATVMGWRELRRLREERRREAGAAFSQAAFHDEILSYGNLPVPLIGWGLGIGD